MSNAVARSSSTDAPLGSIQRWRRAVTALAVISTIAITFAVDPIAASRT
jgi:hypothetical protein